MTVCVDRLPGKLPKYNVVNLEESFILIKSGVIEHICSTARHFFHLDNLKRKQVIPKLLNCSIMNKIEP